MKVLLDFDDFSPRNTSFGLLEEIKEHFPNFKVTLFTVPWEVRFSTPTEITEYVDLADGTRERRWLPFINAIKESKDWIEIALHGLTHTPEEFLNLSYDQAKKRILVGEKMFLNTGIPYTKLFKAPYWQLSEEGKKAAEDLGWVVCEDHYYNWNLKDNLEDVVEKRLIRKYTEHEGEVGLRVDEIPVIIGHGHVQITSGNGLEEVIGKILALPTDTEFGFLSEAFPKAEKIDPSKIDFRDPMEYVEVKIRGEKL